VPETVGKYGDRNRTCGPEALVRVVRLDGGSMAFEVFVGTDAMGNDSWRPLDVERDRILIEGATRQHAEKISADHRSSPVVADLLALIKAVCVEA
jgi:hypothetical protein